VSGAVVNADALSRWLDSTELPGRGDELRLAPIAGGSQNVIIDVERGDLRAVLRMPQPDASPDRDRGMEREWRILSALRGLDVPHAEAYARCEDHTVLGRPFFLMAHVEGWSAAGTGGVWPAPFDLDGPARKELAYRLVEGAALLGAVDWRRQGLGDLGRPDGFHDRQVKRWTSFHQKSHGRDLPGLADVAAWLSENRPLDYIPGLMHGDYSLANVLFGEGVPASLAAIIDWEMATVGDPKLDLAWALVSWPDGSDSDGTAGVLEGMPARRELVEHYAEVSGRQVDDFDYYLILARWKLAIVLEQSFRRAGKDEHLQSFGPMVLDLMAGAAELAGTTDYSNRA
jgi:aminoglycoside phosphotransferase (APT) family kinase protein